MFCLDHFSLHCTIKMLNLKVNCLIDKIFSNRVDEIELTGVITTNISGHYPIFSRELKPSRADNIL